MASQTQIPPANLNLVERTRVQAWSTGPTAGAYYSRGGSRLVGHPFTYGTELVSWHAFSGVPSQLLDNHRMLAEGAAHVLQALKDSDVATRGSALLRGIQQLSLALTLTGAETTQLPKFQLFTPPDGTLRVDMKGKEFILGFVVETEEPNVSWYLASTESLGHITASGTIQGEAKAGMLLWLLCFGLFVRP